MLIVIGKVACAAGRREEFVAAMKTMQEASRTEPGCIDYGFYTSLEDADEFIAVELWADRDALATHFQQETLARFSATLGGVIARPPTVEIHHVERTTEFPNLD